MLTHHEGTKLKPLLQNATTALQTQEIFHRNLLHDLVRHQTLIERYKHRTSASRPVPVSTMPDVEVATNHHPLARSDLLAP